MFSAFQRVPRLLILALTGALLLTLALPLATFAQSTPVQMIKITGDAADATFESVDSTGCIVTDVGVGIGQGNVVVQPGGQTNGQGIAVVISQFDQCASNLLMTAYGNAATGNTTITSLDIAGNLSSATVQATVDVFDIVNSVDFDVAVNLTWQGIGEVQHTQSSATVKVAGFILSAQFNGRMRNATATGSVTANGTDYTPGPSDSSFTNINRQVTGALTVQLP